MQGITWKWNSGLVDHLQTSWPSGCPYCKSGVRVDGSTSCPIGWEHKDFGASWHSSPSLHFRTSRTASFTSHPCHKKNTLLFWSLGPVTCFGHEFPEVPFGSKDGAWHSWLADRSNSSVEEEWSFEATPCSQNESNFCRESVYHAVCSIFMFVQHDSKTASITGWRGTAGALKVWHKTAPRKSIYR